VDRVAALIGENASEWSGSTASDVVERLQRICHHSLRVWVAVDHRGVPGGLFGSSPMSDDADVGQFWMMTFDTLHHADRELQAVARLVFDEMLQDFDRLENVIDSRKTSAIDLLKSVGFAVEPAKTRKGFQARSHRVWLSGGRRQRTPAN
jgi:hypothetical protein